MTSVQLCWLFLVLAQAVSVPSVKDIYNDCRKTFNLKKNDIMDMEKSPKAKCFLRCFIEGARTMAVNLEESQTMGGSLNCRVDTMKALHAMCFGEYQVKGDQCEYAYKQYKCALFSIQRAFSMQYKLPMITLFDLDDILLPII